VLSEKKALNVISMLYTIAGGFLLLLIIPFTSALIGKGIGLELILFWLLFLGTGGLLLLIAYFVSKKIRAALKISLFILTLVLLFVGVSMLSAALVFFQNGDVSALLIGTFLLGLIPFILFMIPWKINIKLIKGKYAPVVNS
jgi:hypothetical protein